MAIQTSTFGASAPGIIPGTMGVESETPQHLAGEIQPGVDVPLVGGDGKVTTTGNTALNAQRNTSNTGTQGTGQSTGTNKPTLNLFQGDNVARGRRTTTASTTTATDSTSSTTKPFSNYSLPDSALQTPKGQAPTDTEDFSAMLTAGVTGVVGAMMKPGGMDWVANRAAFFNANPDQRVLTAFLMDPANQAALSQGLQQAFDMQPLNGDIGATFGQTAQAQLSATQSVLFDSIAAAMVNKPIPGTETVSRLASIGLTPTLAKNLGLEQLLKQGTTPSGTGIIGANGKIDAKLLGKIMSGPFAGVVEASLEFFLGIAGSLLKGDIDKDIDMMSARLKDLQAEKAALLKKIVGLEETISGKQKAASDAAKAAGCGCGGGCAMLSSFLVMGAAIALAVALTVVSCGTAAPLAIGGVVMLSAATMATVAMVAAVAAIAIAVITVVKTVPQMLKALALVAKALGMEQLAQQLDDAADSYAKFMKESGVGKTLDRIQMICQIVLICCTLLTGAARLGSGAAAGAQSTSSTADLLITVSTCAQVGGAITGGIAKAQQAAANKEIAAAIKDLEMARAGFAELELQIKQYFQKD